VKLGALALLACLLLSAPPAFAAATESARSQTSMASRQNTVTADNDVKYVDDVPGQRIPVMLEYSADCNVVFKDLALFRPIGFAPPKIVTGQLTGIYGLPLKGRAANTGDVTFDLKFDSLDRRPCGEQTGMARLNLVLGVDQDCDLSTGDRDGMDRSITIRVQIWVTTGSGEEKN